MSSVNLKAFTMVSEIGQFSSYGKRKAIHNCGFDLHETNEGMYILLDLLNITAATAKRLRHRDHPVRTTSDLPHR